MDIGAIIKNLRIKHGLTQYQLAENLNVSMQTISRWETSVTYPDIAMLPVIAKYFHVTADYLLNIGGDFMETVESVRLLIREWNEKDAEGLLKVKKESRHFMDYIKLYNINDALDCIKIWKKYQEMFPLVLKDTNEIIGVAGLVDINRYKGYRELEVNVCDEYNNIDYVTEAHKLILDFGFNRIGLLTVFAYCSCDEVTAKQAMLNTGFVYEGTLRRFGRDMSDRMRYSIVKEEYNF